MIPPTTNELRQHSDKMANLGQNLHNLNGTGKTLASAAVVVVAVIAVTIFLPQLFTKIA
jgi:diacylglycerol kinase